VVYLLVGCWCLLGVVFSFSAVTKLRSRAAFDGFAQSVRALVPLPSGLVRPVAGGVILAEVSIPLLLSVPETRPWGFGLAGLLLVAFTVVVARAVRGPADTPCRCFGSTRRPLSRRHLVRNAMLLFMAALGGAVAVGDSGLPTVAGASLAAVGGLAVAIALVAYDDIVELFLGEP
jgi:hypothetical protein